eukprot:1194735-Prorocentrum_minimum.AAC.9
MGLEHAELTPSICRADPARLPPGPLVQADVYVSAMPVDIMKLMCPDSWREVRRTGKSIPVKHILFRALKNSYYFIITAPFTNPCVARIRLVVPPSAP